MLLFYHTPFSLCRHYLGTPSDFVKNTVEELGANRIAPQTRTGIVSSILALLVAVASFSIYAITQFEKAPDNAIGYADAITNIRVEGSLGIDGAQIILVVGLIAAVKKIRAILESDDSKGSTDLIAPQKKKCDKIM
jgi:hypothetical protein